MVPLASYSRLASFLPPSLALLLYRHHSPLMLYLPSQRIVYPTEAVTHSVHSRDQLLSFSPLCASGTLGHSIAMIE